MCVSVCTVCRCTYMCASRLSSKQTKKVPVWTEINRNKICFGCVSVCSWNQKLNYSVCLSFFWCFKHISKQPKQTELFWNKPKQTKTTLSFLKNTNMWNMLSICLFRFNRNTEILCFGLSKTTETDGAETSFGSSFGCFESKLVSKDTLFLSVRMNRVPLTLCLSSAVLK